MRRVLLMHAFTKWFHCASRIPCMETSRDVSMHGDITCNISPPCSSSLASHPPFQPPPPPAHTFPPGLQSAQSVPSILKSRISKQLSAPLVGPPRNVLPPASSPLRYRHPDRFSRRHTPLVHFRRFCSDSKRHHQARHQGWAHLLRSSLRRSYL